MYMFMLLNLAPNSFCTNDHSACKFRLKPQPTDLYQIRNKANILFWCYFSLNMPRATLVQTQAAQVTPSIWNIGHACTCCLTYYLLYLLHVTLWSRETQTQGLHTTAFIKECNSLTRSERNTDLEESHIFKCPNPSYKNTHMS